MITDDAARRIFDAVKPLSPASLPLRVVCAYCQRVMREGTLGAPTSHGICATCLEVANQELDAAERAVAERAANDATYQRGVRAWFRRVCAL